MQVRKQQLELDMDTEHSSMDWKGLFSAVGDTEPHQEAPLSHTIHLTSYSQGWGEMEVSWNNWAKKENLNLMGH